MNDFALTAERLASARTAPPTMVQDHGQGSAETRVVDPSASGDGGHAAPDGMLVRTAVVRAVRREARPTEKDPQRSLIIVDAVASTEDIDSHESILACDWDYDGRLNRYESNPILQWMHGRDPAQRPAIGHAENVRCEKATKVGPFREAPATGRDLLFSAVFDDTTEFDKEIATKFEKGVLRAFSVGFAPGEAEVRMIDGREIVVFSKNELREISAVNVPSNPLALATGIGRAQRAIVAAAREMARGVGTPVRMADVLTRVATSQEERAVATTNVPTPLDPPTPLTPSPLPPEPTARGTGEPPMTLKKFDLPDGAVRAAKGGGGSCSVTCPNCDKDFEMSFKSLPMSEEKAAEIEQIRGDLATARSSLTEQTRVADVETKRAAGLETRLVETSARLSAMLLDSATRDVDSRIGKKIEPTERDEELDLARTMLSDTTPDPDAKNADGISTRTLGQKKWSARLAKIDSRRDLGLLGPSITGTTTMPEPSAQVRTVTEPMTATPAVASGGFTRGGEAAASLLDAPATA
jgi:hypothetical protein